MFPATSHTQSGPVSVVGYGGWPLRRNPPRFRRQTHNPVDGTVDSDNLCQAGVYMNKYISDTDR